MARGRADVAGAEHGVRPGLGYYGDSPYQSGTSMAGIRQTGLLAANAFRTFPAFIFKNALAANNGKGSRFKVSGFR